MYITRCVSACNEAGTNFLLAALHFRDGAADIYKRRNHIVAYHMEVMKWILEM